MATCKECLHYDVCKIIHFPSLFGLTGDGCDHFKNKNGKWKRRMDPELDCECITCSVCGEEFCPPNNEWVFYDLPNYCSNCGAKMKGNK